mgnify:CR=1 FL=1
MVLSSRVVLNACLDGIVRGDDVERNVSDAVDILSRFSDIADQTLLYMRSRTGSDFLREELSRDDLSIVGRYKGSRVSKGDRKVVTYEKDDVAVQFLFKRGVFKHSDSFKALLEEKHGYSLEDVERVTLSELGRVLSGVDDALHPNEVLLGKNSRSLNAYELERVDVVRRVPGKFLLVIPVMKSVVSTVYVATPS